MNNRFLAQLFARDPRKEVRFPDVPLDQALVGLQELVKKVNDLASSPGLEPARSASPLGSMPPVVPPDEQVEEEHASPSDTGTPVPAAEEVPASRATDQADEQLGGALAGLATQVWRARAKIIDPATGEPREEMRRVHRHIEGSFDMFAQMGLQMKDWVNQPYDAGLPVKVVTFQPTPGILRDVVLEAVRPTVIWRDRILQLGEVIVGIPEGAGEKSQ